jgi:hypothetical protein
MMKWEIVALILICSAILWLGNKTKADQNGLKIWQETNYKLDRIINIMESK